MPRCPAPHGGGEGVPRDPSPQLHDISKPRATVMSWGPGDLLAGMGVTPGVPVPSHSLGCPPLLTVEPNHCFQD